VSRLLPSPTPPACRIPPAQQQRAPRCPPPAPGKHTPTHPASSAPDAHPLPPRPAEPLQCRPRRGRALTPPAQRPRTPQCTPPVTARPWPAHAAAPAAACALPAPHSPAPKSMARTREHKAEHAGPPTAESLPERRKQEPWPPPSCRPPLSPHARHLGDSKILAKKKNRLDARRKAGKTSRRGGKELRNVGMCVCHVHRLFQPGGGCCFLLSLALSVSGARARAMETSALGAERHGGEMPICVPCAHRFGVREHAMSALQGLGVESLSKP